MGKSGGARVIYFNQLANGEVVLLWIYAKSKLDNVRPEFLLKLKEFEDPADLLRLLTASRLDVFRGVEGEPGSITVIAGGDCIVITALSAAISCATPTK